MTSTVPSKRRREKRDRQIADTAEPKLKHIAYEAAGLHATMAIAAARGMRDLAEKIEEQKDRDFTKVFPAGFRRLRTLAELAQNGSPAPLRLWIELVAQADRTNAVQADYGTLAELLTLSTKTIQRAAKTLEAVGAIVRLRVGRGDAYVYCLDPDEVWRGFRNGKSFAPFVTRTLVSKRSNPEVVARSFRTLVSASGEEKATPPGQAIRTGADEGAALAFGLGEEDATCDGIIEDLTMAPTF